MEDAIWLAISQNYPIPWQEGAITDVKSRLPGIRCRARIARIWAVAAVCVLGVRLGWIQLVSGPRLAAAGRLELTRTQVLHALRGEILARNGQVLAISVPSADVTADPALVRHPHAEAAAIAHLHLPGVYTHTTAIRRYPAGFFMGSLLGFTNATGGVAGLELSYQEQLAGHNGYRIAQVDPFGQRIPGARATTIPARPGLNLRLTLYPGLQAALERYLQAAVASTGATRTYAIVPRPPTGSILAAASWPTYDPNAPGSASPAIWNNTGASVDMPPGSVIKPITASAALQTGGVCPLHSLLRPGAPLGRWCLPAHPDAAQPPHHHPLGRPAHPRRAPPLHRRQRHRPQAQGPGTTMLALRLVPMPAIVNLPSNAAVARVDALGIYLHVQGGGQRILRQNPPAGAMVQKWTTVQAYTDHGALLPRGSPPSPTSPDSACARRPRGWPPPASR